MQKNQKDLPEDSEVQDGNTLPDWCYDQNDYVITGWQGIPANMMFRSNTHFNLFEEHYKDCLMMLELKKGKCPNWIIKYIAAFELTLNDQETPKWIKEMIFPSYPYPTGMDYSQRVSSGIQDSKQDSSDA